MRKYICSSVLVVVSSVASAVSQQNNTLFWQTCTKTAAYDELSFELTRVKNDLKLSDTERGVLRAQNGALADELKKVKAELEGVREGARVALEASRRTRVELDNALRGSMIAAMYISKSKAEVCPAVVYKFFKDSPDYTSATSMQSGARARSEACGVTAFCSNVTDKDGDPYLLVSLNCTTNQESELLEKFKSITKSLR